MPTGGIQKYIERNWLCKALWVLRWLISLIRALHALPQMWQMFVSERVAVLAVEPSPFSLTVSQRLIQDSPTQSGSRLGTLWGATLIYPQPVLPSLLGQSPLSRCAFGRMSLKYFLWPPWDLLLLAVVDLVWVTTVLHLYIMASPAKLVFHDLCLNTDGGSLQRAQKHWYDSHPIWCAGSSAGSALVVSVQIFQMGYPHLTS